MKSAKLLEGTRLKIFKLLNEGYGKFSDIEKLSEAKSNELSYHIKELGKAGLIEKQKEKDIISYSLSEKGKQIYPYLKVITEEEMPVVVVTAVAPIKNEKVMMFEKENEPHKGKLILIGGKAKAEMEIEESAIQKCKEQAGLNVKDLKLRCVNEFIEKKNSIKHHWLVFFYTATAINEPENAVWIELNKVGKYNLFGDNYFLLKNNLDNKEVKFTKTII